MSVGQPCYDCPGLSLHMPDVYDLLSGKMQAPINALQHVCVVKKPAKTQGFI